MKLLFAFTHLNFWMPLDPVARIFLKSGHTVRLLLDRARNQKFEGRYLINQGETPYEIGWMQSRSDALQPLLGASREMISYASYLRLRQPTSPVLMERWSGYLPSFLKPLSRTEKGRRWLSSDGLWKNLHRLEEGSNPSRVILKELEEFKPDVLVAASAIMPFSKEIEYLKAARHLGIPTIVIIPSWDNLTTKGMLQFIPDWLFVWNRGQISEAVNLHNVPEERIFCTGAPKFDAWFQLTPEMDRAAFCRRMGLNPESPYLLYLCSSEFIAGDETDFIDQLIKGFARSASLKDLTLLIRPHPQNLTPWVNYQGRNKNMIIWPEDLSLLDASAQTGNFYHSLFYSMGVMGINTSAFIEAAIVDRPCIAVTSDRYEYTQMGIPHFHHLVDAGFLELTHNINETLNIVEQLLNGMDARKRERRKFVRDFVRPHGRRTPAVEIMTRAIENVMSGQRPGAPVR